MKEGWHKVYDYEVWVNEDGYVIRGIEGEGTLHCRATYPYHYENIGEANWVWNNKSGLIKLDSFRQGVKRGNYRMM